MFVLPVDPVVLRKNACPISKFTLNPEKILFSEFCATELTQQSFLSDTDVTGAPWKLVMPHEVLPVRCPLRHGIFFSWLLDVPRGLLGCLWEHSVRWEALSEGFQVWLSDLFPPVLGKSQYQEFLLSEGLFASASNYVGKLLIAPFIFFIPIVLGPWITKTRLPFVSPKSGCPLALWYPRTAGGARLCVKYLMNLNVEFSHSIYILKINK